MLRWQELSQQLQQIVNTFIRFSKAPRREEAAVGVAAMLLLSGFTFDWWFPNPLHDIIRSWRGDLIIQVGLYVSGLSALAYYAYRRRSLVSELDLHPVVNKPSAIKGPLAFTEADGELFRKLEREEDLRKLLNYIEDAQVRLVVLMGASGAGKTSLLRAGLKDILKDKGIESHYWEAVPSNSGRELLRAIQKSWHSGSKDDSNHSYQPTTSAEIKSLDDLINPAPELGDGRHVVVLDQFEQLSGRPREQVFRLLEKVACKAKPPHSITWVVAFRREFLAEWTDFMLPQNELGFFTPIVSLQLFTPKQALNVISQLVIAADLKVDEKVVESLTQAITTNGKVSPVDVGIGLFALSEVHKEQGGKRLTEDDLNHLHGGAEGLLTQYISGCLELFPEEDRETVLKAMLALRDVQNNHRLAEGKTCAELAAEVETNVRRLCVQLERLAQRDKRLLERFTPPDGEEIRYRLQHERLIPALNSLAGPLIDELETARDNLANAFAAWQRSKDSRYLLRGKDLRLVEQYWSQISGDKEQEKKLSFLKRSQRRRLIRLISVALTISLLSPVIGLVFLQLNFNRVTIEEDFARRVVVRHGIISAGLFPGINNRIVLDTGYSESDLYSYRRRESDSGIQWISDKGKDELFRSADFSARLASPIARLRWHCAAGEKDPCVTSLLDAIKHEHPEMRRAAINAFGEAVRAMPTVGHLIVEQLTEFIRTERPWVRHDAALALGKVVKARPELCPQSAARLKELLPIDEISAQAPSDEELDVRGNAAYALGKVVEAQPSLTPEVVEPLTKLLRDIKTGSVSGLAAMRRKTISALGKVVKAQPERADQILAPLLEVLRDVADARELKELFEFLEGASALGEIVHNASPETARQIVAHLINLLSDSSSNALGNTAAALGKVVRANPTLISQVVSPLLQLLEGSKDGYVDGFVIYALGEIVTVEPDLSKQFVEPLIKGLHHTEWWVRYNAALALGKVVKVKPDLATRIYKPLVRNLNENAVNTRPRQAAAQALGEVIRAQPELAGELIEPLTVRLKVNDPFVHPEAADSLGEVARVNQLYRPQAFTLVISDRAEIRKGVSEPLARLLAAEAREFGGVNEPIQFLFDHLEGKQSLLPPDIKQQCGDNADTCAVYRQIVVTAIAYWLVSQKQHPAMQTALKQRLETMRGDINAPAHLRIAAWDAFVLAADFRDDQASDNFNGFDE